MKNMIAVVLTALTMSFRFNNDNALLYQQSLLDHISKEDIDTVYVLKCFDIELPSKIGKHIIVDISENTGSFLHSNPSLSAIKLMPVEMNKGIIEIALIDYVIKNNRAGELIMSNTGSVVYSYKYERSTKKYILLKKSKKSV
jgi:hypothetical protein